MAKGVSMNKKEFEERIEQLISEVGVPVKAVEAEIGKLSGIRGELRGIVKELDRIKAMLEEKGEQALNEEELEEIRDAEEILTDEWESKKRKTEAILREKEKGEEAEKYLTDLTYLKAEFENYKRRAEKDKRDFADYLLEGVIAELLPIEDNLEVAIEHAKENKYLGGMVKVEEMELIKFKEISGRDGVLWNDMEREQ